MPMSEPRSPPTRTGTLSGRRRSSSLSASTSPARASARRAGSDVPVLEAGDLVIDLPARRVTKSGSVVRLTPTEWGLLEMLVRTPGRLVSQRDLLHEVWGPTYDRETNYLRVYVGGLRKKLEDDPSRPRHLITEPGMGYRFEP